MSNEPTGVDLDRVRNEVAIATFADGGLLLHLPSGNVFQLDLASAAIWRAIVGDADLIKTSGQTGAPSGPEGAPTRAILEAAAAKVAFWKEPRPIGAYRFDESGSFIDLCKNGRRLLRFDRPSLNLTLGDEHAIQDGDDIGGLIGLFVPKILATWFPLTMHASAIAVAGEALLFSGASEAGKTTTARVLSEQLAGAHLLSEDIVVFSETRHTARMLTAGESLVRNWICEATAAFVRDRGTSVDAERLGLSIRRSGQDLSVRKVVFLDPANRRGQSWCFEPIGHGQALKPLFLNSFLPSSTATILRAHLKACSELAEAATVWKATSIPDGVASLRASSRAQSATIAS